MHILNDILSIFKNRNSRFYSIREFIESSHFSLIIIIKKNSNILIKVNKYSHIYTHIFTHTHTRTKKSYPNLFTMSIKNVAHPLTFNSCIMYILYFHIKAMVRVPLTKNTRNNWFKFIEIQISVSGRDNFQISGNY